VTLHSLKSRAGFLSPLATQQLGVPLFKSREIREILDKGFDVIHYHNVSLVGGPAILKYGQAIKLYTMHEYWLVCPTHVLFRFNRAPCTQPHCVLCGMVYRRPPQWWRYSRLLSSAIEQIDTFIAPSRFSEKVHRRMGLRLPTVILPNFVPANSLVDVNSTVPDTPEPYFLFVGRLEKLKGLQTIIPVFRRYEKARLLIAGTGGYESDLRQHAEGCPRISFLGQIDQAELQGLYRGAVAVIVPSICFELFPLVMIEAFRQQTPTIVRNLGGMSEIVEQSKGGLTFNTDQELIDAMDLLLSDSATRMAMGSRGYQAYKQKWTADAHLQRYLEIIHEIAAARSRSK
jgi:glycosyltransferase involved in cell wall biosynthesis